jgi:phosphoglycerate dehydrogenase-like enzyme
MSEAGDTIKVVLAVDFSDEIVEHLRAISPRLHVERHFPKVPDSAYADAEVLYTTNEYPEPEQAPRLRWIQSHSAGMNHALDKAIIQAEDVEVTTTSGIHATPMAEYCLAIMLAFAYRLPEFRRFQDRAEWVYRSKPTTALRGQTLGIVGYGSIGRELARLADEMGMIVVATKRDLRQTASINRYVETNLGDPEAEIPTRLYPPQALASMVRVCDYVVLTLPLTDESYHLIDENILEAMKKTAYLINVSRGSIVDEAALISALAAEKIAGAGLDVTEQEPLPSTSPLWQMDNVIITPHISGNNDRYHERAAAMFAENLERYLENRPLLNKLERERGY